jgi:putative ABC transport system permease protein
VVGLVLGAIARRRAQAALLFLLALVAATGAAAAPGYIIASTQTLAESAVTNASSAERVISVDENLSWESASGPTPLAASAAMDRFFGLVPQRLVLPGFSTVEDARIAGRVGGLEATLAYRQDACEHIVVEGACPRADGEVAVSLALAGAARLEVGDPVSFSAPPVLPQPARLTVVGVFRPRAPFDVYWGRSNSAPGAALTSGQRLREGMLLTTPATLAGVGAVSAAASVDFAASPEAFRRTDPQQLLLASWRGRDALRREGYAFESGLQSVVDRIWFDQQLVYFGVPVGAVQLIVLCWFALFLAVRQTGEERRLDVAKLKLHGARRRDMWLLVAGQSVIPLLAGGVVGLVLGPYLAQLAVGDVTGGGLRDVSGYAAAAAAVVTVAGAVVAALVAERRMVRESVVELSRRVPGRSQGWRSWAFDLAILTVALAGAYQLRLRGGEESQTRGLAVAAPVLVALAVGLLTARLVPWLAGAAAPGFFNARRLGSWLVSVNLARRAARSRVLALLTLAVAVFGSAVIGWDVSTRARADRAAFEVGAHRVLTVEAPSRAALLAAVRSIDPDGRYAMAAVQTFGTLRVLAVDTTRLDRVVALRPSGGQGAGADWATIARALRPTTPDAVRISGREVRLTASWLPIAESNTRQPPVRVAIRFVDATGSLRTVTLGPLRFGRHEYTAAVPVCGPESTCRLVSLGLTGTPAVDRPEGTAPPPGSTLVLHALTQLGPDAGVVSPEAFADRSRWRHEVRRDARLPVLATTDDGLKLVVNVPPPAGTPAATGPEFPSAVYALDAPMPLPAVASTPLPAMGDPGDPQAPAFGGATAPVGIVAETDVIPRLGRGGLLVDFEYADRLVAAEPTVGVLQVWLGPDAPAGTMERLDAAGITVVSVDSTDDRLAQLAAQGPPVAMFFVLIVGAAGLLLALVSFAVWAAVERPLRGQELAALRQQGLRPGPARVAAVGGYLAFVGAAVGVGAAMAMLLRAIDTLTVFGDGWSLLPAPSASLALGAGTVLVALLVLGTAAAVAGMALLRAARRAEDVA